MKPYNLVQPDIDVGSSRAKKLIAELKNCEGFGADEICAAIKVLTDPEEQASFFYPKVGGAIDGLKTEFRSFISGRLGTSKNLSDKIQEAWCWDEIPLHIEGFASATGAVYSALTAARVGGGEVITSSLNYVGVVNAILLAGALPKFVDVNPKTFCMERADVEKAVTGKTRAVILTHLNSFLDIEPFFDMFKGHGFEFPFIQDASLAIGSTFKGMRPGLINVGPNGVTVFSLAISKIISGLSGALATSHNSEFINSMREIAYQGISLKDNSYIGSMGGANFKMAPLNAAIAAAMLKRREEIFEKRRKLKKIYDNELTGLVAKGLLSVQQTDSQTIMTHYPAVLSVNREQVVYDLFSRFGIQVGMWYVHHMQPLFKILLGSDIPKLPASERLSERLVFLPFHTKLCEGDVAYIASALSQVLSEKSARTKGRVHRKRKITSRSSRSPRARAS